MGLAGEEKKLPSTCHFQGVQKDTFLHQDSVGGFGCWCSSETFSNKVYRVYHLMELDGRNRHIFVLWPLSTLPLWRAFAGIQKWCFSFWWDMNIHKHYDQKKDSNITMNMIQHSKKLETHQILNSPGSKIANDITLLSTTEKYLRSQLSTFRLPHIPWFRLDETIKTTTPEIVGANNKQPSWTWLSRPSTKYESMIYESIILFVDVVFLIWKDSNKTS